MFNYKSLLQKKFSQANPTQSGQILNQLGSPNAENEEKPPSDPRYAGFAREIQRLKIQVDKEKKTFDEAAKLKEKIKIITGPFSKIAPTGLKNPCDVTGEMLNSYVSPEEINKSYDQYLKSYKRYIDKAQELLNKVRSIPEKYWTEDLSRKLSYNQFSQPAQQQSAPREQAPQQKAAQVITTPRLPQPPQAPETPALPKQEYGENTLDIENIDNQLNILEQEIKVMKFEYATESRQYEQYQILYQDMYNYYALLSNICETETRYNAQVESFKFGDPEDYKALLSYYEYGIALLRIMAPKAAQVSPGYGKNLINYYKSIINEFQAKINTLSLAPLKALYGQK
jgi:hypothetical protein